MNSSACTAKSHLSECNCKNYITLGAPGRTALPHGHFPESIYTAGGSTEVEVSQPDCGVSSWVANLASALITVDDASCTRSANGFRCSLLFCGPLTVVRRAYVASVLSLRASNLCFSTGAFVDWCCLAEI